MRHVTTVAGRELRSLFVSPVAYVVLSLFAALAGLFFVIGVASFNTYMLQLQQFQAFDRLQELNLSDDLVREFFRTMAFMLMLLLPGITMGLFTSEKTNGTQELLMTSPLTIWDIVLGKFMAGALFVSLMVAVVGAFPALLFVYGDPEVGKTVTGLLGVLLVGWSYVAIGGFASSLTRSQVVSFLVTLVLLVLLLLLPVVSVLGVAGETLSAVFNWFSAAEHLEVLLTGLVDTSDLAYFAVMIGVFLLLTKASVESVRWR